MATMSRAGATGQRDTGHPYGGVSRPVTPTSNVTVRDMSRLVPLVPLEGRGPQ